MDIKDELIENRTVLALMSGSMYNNVIIQMINSLADESVCYVTLNKTYDSLKELFEKNGVKTDKIVFVDAISKTIKNVPDQVDGCYFIDSPQSIIDISMTVSKLLNHGFKYMIFDSITSLAVYEEKNGVIRFITTLSNKIAESDTKGIFYAIKIKDQEELIEESKMIVNKVVDLTEFSSE